MSILTDIDIDFADRTHALAHLPHVSAMIMVNGAPQKHASGVYFQDAPADPVTGFCVFPYEEAEELGYFKIDFLNSTIYKGVRDEEHLAELVDRDPDWSLFEHEEVVSRLSHIHAHHGLVRMIAPKSIEDLAVVLALVRPGKRHLMGKSRAEIDAEIWDREGGQYTYKKSHATAYAVSIVVQLNLMCEKVVEKFEAGEEFEW